MQRERARITSSARPALSRAVSLEVLRVVSAPFDVNVHVVKEDGRAIVIDASSGLDWPDFAPKLATAIGGATVDALYLTHVHVDHVAGAARVARMCGLTEARMHEGEAFVVESGDARLTGGAMFDVPQEALPVRVVKEGDIIEIGRRRFEVLLVPGHSPAHTALWDAEARALFPGDVVFAHGAFGRVDLPGASAKDMIRSLERLAALDAVAMYPGHMEDVLSNARDSIRESLDNARLMLG
jgi:hydroxyacylglutathione hydrolase